MYIYYLLGVLSVIGTSITVFFISVRNKYKVPIWVIYSLFFVSVYMLVTQYLKYSSLHFYVDFSHWTQLFYNISDHGRPFSQNVELLKPGTLNYLSVHFVPFVYILAVPFKVWPYSATIIVLNFLLMASAVIPLYKLALTCNKDKLFALFVAVLLLWYPTFQYVVLYEFEMLRFSIPIILWMLYFWQKKRMAMYYLFVVLAVFVREEVGLTIMMFGLYLFFIEKQRRTGFTSSLIGMAAFIIITQIIMPSLRGGDAYEHIAIGSFSVFGNTISEVIINVFKKPFLVLETILQPIKLANVFMLFLPLLFIPFGASMVLIATLGNFGVGLLSQSNLHISYMLFYVSPSVPFIFYAFIKGWPKFLVLLETFFERWVPTLKRGKIDSSARAMVLSGILVANVFFGPSPISLQFWFKDLRPAPFETQNFHYSVYKITDHHRAVDEFVRPIPDSAIVAAPYHLHPRLFKKKGSIIFPRFNAHDDIQKANYVLIDKTNNGLTESSTVYRTQRDFDVVEKDKETWELVKSGDGYFLYRRIGNMKKLKGE